MDRNELVDRVKRRLAGLDRGPVEAAIMGGLERNYIRDLIEGRKESVREANLSKIAKGLNWTKGQLLSQEDVNLTNDSIAPSTISTSIPEIEITAGANYAGGYGQEENTTDNLGNTVSRDVIRAKWGVPTPFLKDELHLTPSRVHILPIKGDSMTDALYDGDRAIIALDDVDVSQGGIFAILDENGSLIVKQVELIRGKGKRRILCTSRNQHYQPFELTLDDPVRIIGRVACKITRL